MYRQNREIEGIYLRLGWEKLGIRKVRNVASMESFEG